MALVSIFPVCRLTRGALSRWKPERRETALRLTLPNYIHVSILYHIKAAIGSEFRPLPLVWSRGSNPWHAVLFSNFESYVRLWNLNVFEIIAREFTWCSQMCARLAKSHLTSVAGHGQIIPKEVPCLPVGHYKGLIATRMYCFLRKNRWVNKSSRSLQSKTREIFENA